MTKVIVVHGENGESENGKLVLPVAGAEYIGIFNTSLNKVKNNFSPFKKNVSTVGSIALNANDVTLKSQANYLQTDIDETADFTTFCVMKTSHVPNSIESVSTLISNYKTPPKDGSSAIGINSMILLVGADGKLSLVCSEGNNAADASGVIMKNSTIWTPNEYQLVVGQVQGLKISVNNISKGLLNYGNLTKPRYLAAGKLRIGSAYSTYTGTTNIALLIHFSRALNDVEIDQVSTWIRNYMSIKGIVV